MPWHYGLRVSPVVNRLLDSLSSICGSLYLCCSPRPLAMHREEKWAVYLLAALFLSLASATGASDPGRRRSVIEVEGEPSSVVWVVQLSDLHLSVFHPERARDFKRYVPPALAVINPSLVLITGDLTGIIFFSLVTNFFYFQFRLLNPRKHPLPSSSIPLKVKKKHFLEMVVIACLQ